MKKKKIIAEPKRTKKEKENRKVFLKFKGKVGQ
jgi:hypothetical protein